MFAAFIKLHKQGPQVKNGYWLKIGPVLRWVMGIVPLILLLVSLFFTLVPETVFGVAEETETVEVSDQAPADTGTLAETAESEALTEGETLVDKADEEEATEDNSQIVLLVSTGVCIVIGELMVLNMSRKDRKKKLAKKNKR